MAPRLSHEERLRRYRERSANEHAERMRRQVVKAGRPAPQDCEACDRKSIKTHFDHDHTTGAFRGWLCPACNQILGLAKDNAKTLQRLSKYLTVAKGQADRPSEIPLLCPWKADTDEST